MEKIRAHYEAFPYPETPLFARLDRARLALLNYRAAVFACFGSTAFAAPQPRILVAGCGTFEAVAVAAANPGAQIVAVDLSERALRRLRVQAFLRGRAKQITLCHANLLELPLELGDFDSIVATGVLHHLPDPEAGLRALTARLRPRGVMRLMLYSRHGREWIERLRDWRKLLGIEDRRGLEKSLGLLPASHPFRLSYALYTDARTESGLRDGLFHVQERGFDALEMRAFLAQAGIEARKFLHKLDGQPEALAPWGEALDPWERIAVLDRWNALEENFLFLAAKKAAPICAADGQYELNEVLLPFRGRAVYSRILDRALCIEIPEEGSADARAMEAALFLLRGGVVS